MVAASTVADMAAQALSAQGEEPPPPLPAGWYLKESRSQPGVYYYYDQETGQSFWDPPQVQMQQDDNEEEQETVKKEEQEDEHVKSETSSNKRSRDVDVKDEKEEEEDQKVSKRKKETPTVVRVLHILKKHKESKRPSSWRQKNITISRQEAREELQGLLEILREEQSPESLIATFKELASQESDCSSAKRKGDLGTFGRKKMRPEFEEAAFNLDINELSGIVETSSGLHILLRLE